MEALRLGIDLGGTNVKVGLIGDELEMIDKVKYPTPELATEEQCAAFAKKLRSFVEEAKFAADDLEGIGIAIPGTIRGAQVELLPNMELELQTLLEALRDKFPNAELSYINDANAGALAEATFGAGMDYQSVLYVTIGTGLGSGIVIDGHVLSGANGAAGEIGHVSVTKGGRRCSCGKRGCVEQYASARGIVRTFLEIGANAPSVYNAHGETADGRKVRMPHHDTDSLTVFKAYEESDYRAVQAVDVFAKALGIALAQVSCVLDPDIILLGGGVAGSAHVYLSKVQKVFEENVIGPCKETEIRQGSLGNAANVLGAAYYSMLQ